MSILFGANYNCQPIPPLIVFPTTAKAPKLELKLLQTLHQVCEKNLDMKKSGGSILLLVSNECNVPLMKNIYSLTHFQFVAFSENGSVTKEIFYKWYREVIVILFPDMEDVPGKCVLLKSDGGPGRTHLDYLAASNLDGLIHYPGLPNGTLFQELDQIFALLKSKMEHNCNRIWEVKFGIDYEHAKVGLMDFAYLLFGGTYHFVTGSSISLENAFAIGPNPEHLQSANKKCGYIPATRVALESGQLWHEIVLKGDGQIDFDWNDLNMTKTLLAVEKLNHATVDSLTKSGYIKAESLHCCLKQNKQACNLPTSERKLTIPGTTEHQRKLAKASTQGKHFKVTNGGAPMNSNDCMIAAEL